MWQKADITLPIFKHNREITMREITGDPFYKLIEKYDRCLLDFFLIEADTPYQGIASHKEAVDYAMCLINESYLCYQIGIDEGEDENPFNWDIDKASAEPISPASLLYAPNVIGKDCNGMPKYDCDLQGKTSGGQLPYWYAFLNEPCITGYTVDDFAKINSALFPNGKECLEVYEWSTNWSTYFDDGHEWWGAACFSIYDKSLNRYAVIMASATD